MKTVKYEHMIAVSELADAIYAAYVAMGKLNCGIVQPIGPIFRIVCDATGWDRQRFGKELEIVFRDCIRGTLPYQMMLEVDMTPVEQAAWHRTKRENQIWVSDRPVAIIEMKRRS